MDHRHRVRVEGRDDRVCTQGARSRDETGKQVSVPEVDAVEVADRHDGPGAVVELDLVE
jgi:hypothetical protein